MIWMLVTFLRVHLKLSEDVSQKVLISGNIIHTLFVLSLSNSNVIDTQV